ncbi:hypothetical protein BDW22DRAFT_1353226 [Trametopsis cervina]|nr:hypothetical protein BDW22DRAFT_1353226 [Trametopsis cervina]
MDAETQEQYTILRIKRKRNEEPLDALVIESKSRRKKSKAGMNVFQFAETVEQAAWDDEKQKQDLQSRLTSLAREKAKRAVKPMPGATPSTSTTTEEPSRTADGERIPKLPQIDDPSRKYMIVPSNSVETPVRTAKSRLTAPPKVHSYKELQKASITMYDAIPSSTSLANLASPSTSADDEIDKFLPMLKDYLRLNGADTSMGSSASSNSLPATDDDYVWDVFYSRPATFRELYGSNTNIGTVTGLPDDDMYNSDSDSDYEDEDDEDSNAEDWYKNDYPEEESASDDNGEDGVASSEGSDAYHEDSDFDELVHDHSNHMWAHR